MLVIVIPLAASDALLDVLCCVCASLVNEDHALTIDILSKASSNYPAGYLANFAVHREGLINLKKRIQTVFTCQPIKLQHRQLYQQLHAQPEKTKARLIITVLYLTIQTGVAGWTKVYVNWVHAVGQHCERFTLLEYTFDLCSLF